MEYSVLKKIGEDKTDDVRFLIAMDSWLQSDPKASWKKVVRALRAIRKEVLAQELEEKYCRDGGSEPHAPRGRYCQGETIDTQVCEIPISMNKPSIIEDNFSGQWDVLNNPHVELSPLL